MGRKKWVDSALGGEENSIQGDSFFLNEQFSPKTTLHTSDFLAVFNGTQDSPRNGVDLQKNSNVFDTMDLHENNSPNVLNNENVDSPNINPTSIENNTRNKFGIVFSRIEPKLGGLSDNLQHGQESSLSPSSEILCLNPLLEKDELDLPIALKKGT